MIIKIVVIGIIAMISFTAGAAWLQTKETQMGIKAEYDCNNCEAEGCQAKWCKSRKEILEDVRK